jgi:DNA-directed RNA polymerase specialized sigma24 family protein
MPRHSHDPPDDDDPLRDDDDEPADPADSPPDPSDDAPSDDDEDDDDKPEPDIPVEGDDVTAPRIDPAIVRRFLDTKPAFTIARNAVRKIVPPDQVDDIATDALVRALRALPPHTEIVLPRWLAAIAERTAMRWLDKRKRRSKYEGPMPTHVAREDDYTGEAVDTEDAADTSDDPDYDPDNDEEPAELLGDHLDRLIGEHARDREVIAIIREASESGKSYAEIAAARGLTPAQVANRILRFKAKYATRVKRRRTSLFFLKVFGWTAAAAVALVVAWYLFLRPRTADIGPDPAIFQPRITPSASASAPLFLQALPPDPSSSPRDQPDRKPRPPPP